MSPEPAKHRGAADDVDEWEEPEEDDEEDPPEEEYMWRDGEAKLPTEMRIACAFLEGVHQLDPYIQ